MIKTNKLAYFLGAVILIVSFIVFMPKAHGSASTLATPACAITHTTVSVGAQNSVTVLSANSRRAWATVEQPLNATNTVSVNLGSNAVVNTGTLLAPATTTISKTNIQVGLDTDLPYVGAINAITGTGSSTVLVTQCVY